MFDSFYGQLKKRILRKFYFVGLFLGMFFSVIFGAMMALWEHESELKQKPVNLANLTKQTITTNGQYCVNLRKIISYCQRGDKYFEVEQ